jgi:hypothetical protein
VRAKTRKAFFSEEKKQKTFMSGALPTLRPWPESISGRRNKSLFASFSSEKEGLSFEFSPCGICTA